jgi:hypothetical protein
MNGSVFDRSSNSTNSCDMRLVIPYSGWTADVGGGYRWDDDSLLLSEPLIAFGMSAGEDAKIRGQLWDAVWCSGVYNGDLTSFSFDSKTWYSITNANNGLAARARGTLLHVIP